MLKHVATRCFSITTHNILLHRTRYAYYTNSPRERFRLQTPTKLVFLDSSKSVFEILKKIGFCLNIDNDKLYYSLRIKI